MSAAKAKKPNPFAKKGKKQQQDDQMPMNKGKGKMPMKKPCK